MASKPKVGYTNTDRLKVKHPVAGPAGLIGFLAIVAVLVIGFLVAVNVLFRSGSDAPSDSAAAPAVEYTKMSGGVKAKDANWLKKPQGAKHVTFTIKFASVDAMPKGTSKPAKVFVAGAKDGAFIWNGPKLAKGSPVYAAVSYKHKHKVPSGYDAPGNYEVTGGHSGQLPNLPSDATSITIIYYGWA
jgi:hypothetical protein